MSTIYLHFDRWLPTKVNGYFVEIGSDNGEESTPYLDGLASRYATQLITVDVSDRAQRYHANNLDHTQFVVDHGSSWADDFAFSGHKISLLYLDNFDYIWDVDSIGQRVQRQIAEYAARGVLMRNQACQIEHLKQLLLLYPCLDNQAVVAFDDTYLWNDCWVGKGGPAVVYLLASGWRVVEQTLECGVILKKLDFDQA